LHQTRAKAVFVGAAGTGGDAVDVALDVLVGGLGPAQGSLDLDVAAAEHEEGGVVHGLGFAELDQVGEVIGDAVFVQERLLGAGRLVDELDANALVEVTCDLESLPNQFGVEVRLGKDRRVWLEEDGGSRAAGTADLLQLADGNTVVEV